MSAAVKTTITVKLSSGRIVSITFEGSKPLQTNSTGALVTDTSIDSTSPSHSSTKMPNDFGTYDDNPAASEGKSCALSVNLSLDLANHSDVILSFQS